MGQILRQLLTVSVKMDGSSCISSGWDMHFIIHWEIKAAPDERPKLARELRECLAGYSWVKPLHRLFIVRARSELSRSLLVQRLKGVAKNNPGKVYFVASPLMKGGKYRGWLPRKFWPMIDKRVQDVEQRQ
jgi:hypothetical protein